MTEAPLPVGDPTLTAAAAPERAARTRWNLGLVVGLVGLLAIVVVAFAYAPFVGDAANTVSDDIKAPASWDHWLGTDSLGRDSFARAVIATRLTLLMTVAAALISVVLGVLIGGGLWLAPRWVREPGLRVVEIVTAYPGLILAMIIATILGPGFLPVVIAIGLSNTLTIARLSANLAASLSQQDYVTQARLFGVPGLLLLRRHLLPNMAEPLLLVSSTMFALTLMDISALSFLGLGIQVPDYDLGRLLSNALPEIYTRPLAVVGPVLMISLVALFAMLIGDGLAAIADPRSSVALKAAKARRRRTDVVADDATAPFAEVRNLSIQSPAGRTLVRDVNLHIGKGEVLGLVGESGSGKSLTAMSLARLLPDGLAVEADMLRVGGLDMLGDPAPRDLARTVSLVYQDPGTTFTPLAAIGSQLRDPLVRHMGMGRKPASDAVVEALRKVHILAPERVAARRPYTMSGGMLQRAMIASALSMDPELIIADEPTTALDVTVQREILRELRNAVRTRDTSMLFISHDIAVVEALCDRIVVMKDGGVVEVLTQAQLAARDVSADYTRELLAAVPSVQRRAQDQAEGTSNG